MNHNILNIHRYLPLLLIAGDFSGRSLLLTTAESLIVPVFASPTSSSFAVLKDKYWNCLC